MQLPPESVRLGELRYLATLYSEAVVPESDIRKEDVTDYLRLEIERRISRRHLVNIQILGQVTDGKSTLMLKLVSYILSCMGKRLSLDNIAGDQVEGLRKIADPSFSETCVGIDEWNQLATTGLNSTTESAQYQYYSDVQAQRYVHKVACSPSTVVDPNADIILQVVSLDKELKRTHFLVSYRLVKPEQQLFQLVGLASVSVADILSDPVYLKYREKKFAKMDLVTREGVRDVRELEQSRTILAVYERLEPMSEFSPVTRDICSVYCDVVRHESSELHSILTTDDIVRKVHGLLHARCDISALRRRSLSCADPVERDRFSSQLSVLEATHAQALAHYRRMIGVYEKYKAI